MSKVECRYLTAKGGVGVGE